ncbi:MAG: sulfatase [Clostridia bacterium]|nr:sulfatase [Clostridia bacterium]
MQKSYVNLILLGIATGIICTFVDGLYIIGKNSYLPYSYPIIIFSFNIFLWTSVGCLAAFGCFLMSRVIRRKNTSLHPVFCFFIPFVLGYGLLGSMPLPNPTISNERLTSCIDTYLSFLGVAAIIVFLCISIKKQSNEALSPLTLIVEIIICIILFHFCAYARQIGEAIQHRIPLLPNQFSFLLYLIGMVVIVGGYMGIYFRLRATINKKITRYSYSYILMGILFVLTCTCLVIGYLNNVKLNLSALSTLNHNNASAKKLPPIILIVLDALRADRLSLYSRSGVRVPNLEQFANDSLVFTHCIAPSSWTLPAHASLFTGLYVSEHKCEFILFPLPILANNRTTMAELLQMQGYRTAAVVANFGWLDPKFNIHQGFEMYDCTRTIGILGSLSFHPLLCFFSYLSNRYLESIVSYKQAEYITAHAIDIVRILHKNPFFLFLNYMETHTPYLPPRPFDNIYAQKKFPQLHRLHHYILKITGLEQKDVWDAFLKTQYDGEIAYLDSQLGVLFSFLKQIGIYDSALIIVTSDHGELLGEHGEYEHHGHLYEPVVKIPLIIKFPHNIKIGRNDNWINLVDLLPTVLSICNLPVPQDISGRAFGGDDSRVAELYSFELGVHKVIYDGNYKYMTYQTNDQAKQYPYKLFDLAFDPNENENLLKEKPDIAATMQKQLKKWESARLQLPNDPEAPAQKSLPQNIKENLRTLGYIQ